MAVDEAVARRRGRRWFVGTTVALVVAAILPMWFGWPNFMGDTVQGQFAYGQPLPVVFHYRAWALNPRGAAESEWHLSRAWAAHAGLDLLTLAVALVVAWRLLRAGGWAPWLRAAGVLAVFLVLKPVAWVDAWRQLSAIRREAWVERAVTDVERWSADPAWVASRTGRPDDWLQPHFLLMRNGEWLTFCQVAGKTDRTLDDVFVAKGADGRWYYSEFHFCVGLVTARMMGPFASLADFVEQLDRDGSFPTEVSSGPPIGDAHRETWRARHRR